MIEDFTKWLVSCQPEIDNVSTLLATQLSSEPQELINDLTAVECWNSRLNELLANCTAFLERAKLFYLPSDPEMRETERKAIRDEKVVDIQKSHDILESLVDCIKQRLILGESILRYERPTHTPEVKDPNAYLRPQKTAAQIMRGE